MEKELRYHLTHDIRTYAVAANSDTHQDFPAGGHVE
jgi:hypothetical protein